jgi:hypothetical protein
MQCPWSSSVREYVLSTMKTYLGIRASEDIEREDMDKCKAALDFLKILYWSHPDIGCDINMLENTLPLIGTIADEITRASKELVLALLSSSSGPAGLTADVTKVVLLFIST